MIVIHGVQTFFEGEFLFQFKALKKVAQSPNHSAAKYLILQVYLRFFKAGNTEFIQK